MLWTSKFEGLKNGKGILGLLKGHVWWVLFSMENTFTFMFTIIITTTTAAITNTFSSFLPLYYFTELEWGDK